MIYKGKIKDLFRLVRVLKTHPEADGLVRTVTVCYKQRDARVKNASQSKLVEEKVHVQRLAVLQYLETIQENV